MSAPSCRPCRTPGTGTRRLGPRLAGTHQGRMMLLLQRGAEGNVGDLVGVSGGILVLGGVSYGV